MRVLETVGAGRELWRESSSMWTGSWESSDERKPVRY
jgi:hypothetical protein